MLKEWLNTYSDFLKTFYPDYSINTNDVPADFPERLYAGMTFVANHYTKQRSCKPNEDLFKYLVCEYVYQASTLRNTKSFNTDYNDANVYNQIELNILDKMYMFNLVSFKP